MRVRLTVSLLSVAVLLLPFALTQTTSAAPATNPFDTDYFTGTFVCKTTSDPNKAMVGKSYTEVGSTIGKSWQRLAMPGGEVRITHDRKLNKNVAFFLGDDGSYGMAESTGWDGNTMIIHDTVNGGGAPLGTTTLIKTNANHYTQKYSFHTPKGAMLSTSDCTRKS